MSAHLAEKVASEADRQPSPRNAPLYPAAMPCYAFDVQLLTSSHTREELSLETLSYGHNVRRNIDRLYTIVSQVTYQQPTSLVSR